MHQERNFPGRVYATDIVNPDFKAMAEVYGGFGIRVDSTEEFAEALQSALNAAKPALIHVRLDPEAITPDRRLSELGRVS
jgi:acetolactate synthase-1/2/3 large subunit